MMVNLFKNTRTILEMIRFSHTIFALPFALLAALMAWMTLTVDGLSIEFRIQDLIGILTCMVFARSAAMSFNRLIDRQIDAENPRTQSRHLPTGQLTVYSVTVFTVICCLGFVTCTLLFLPNRLPLYLAIPVLIVLLAYSYTKRFTMLAHVWLGFSLMLAPVATWIALRGLIVTDYPADLVPAMMLGLGVLCWVTGFDIIYACQDFEFDRRANLKSVPTRFGIPGALRIAAGCHVFMILILALLPAVARLYGLEVGFGWIYYVGLAAVAALLAYEHWLVRPDNLNRVNIAFFNVNAIVSIGLFIIGAIDVFV